MVGSTVLFLRAAWPWQGRSPRADAEALGRTLLSNWEADAPRRVLWLPVGFGGGIGCYFALAMEPPPWWALAAGLAGLAFALTAVMLARVPLLQAALALTAAFSMGYGDAQWRSLAVAAPVLARKAGPLHLIGRVESVEIHKQRLRLTLGSLQPIPRLGPATPQRVRISIRPDEAAIRAGDWVAMTAMLMPPPDPALPGAYDFGRAAWFMRLGAVGFAYGRPHLVAPLEAPSWLQRWSAAIERLRTRITERITAVIGGPEGPIAASLVTGKRGGIDEEDNAAFRDAGLAHVLVIAGLHLSLAAGFVFWLVRALLAAVPALALHYPIKKWAALAALVSAAGFLVLSGAGQPAMRAAIMLAVMLGAILVDRPALSMRSLALAAFIILSLEPESLVMPGFQMSFAAVTGLVARAEWQRTRPRREVGPEISTWWRMPAHYLGGIAMTSAVAGLFTAPFAIYHFGRAAQYGVLGNILALPVVGLVIMPAAVLAMVAMPFGLDGLPLWVMGRGIWLDLKLAHFVSSLPGAAAMVPSWPLTALVAGALGGLWLVIWQARWRWLGMLPIAAALVLALATPQPDIFIARDGGDVAVRLSDGRLHFLQPVHDAFTAAAILQHDGDARNPSAAVGGADCDSDGCVTRLPGGGVLALARRFDALRTDCQQADIVISAVPTRHRCGGRVLVIDRFDVQHNGAYTIWIGPPLRLETVRAWRGQRPWSMPPRRSEPRGFQYRRINPTSRPWTRTRSAP